MSNFFNGIDLDKRYNQLEEKRLKAPATLPKKSKGRKKVTDDKPDTPDDAPVVDPASLIPPIPVIPPITLPLPKPAVPTTFAGFTVADALRQVEEEKKRAASFAPDAFWVEKRSGNLFKIHNFDYFGRSSTADITTALLDSGVELPQEEWLQRKLSAPKPSAKDYVGSAGLYHAIFRALYEHKDDAQNKDAIDEIHNKLEKILVPNRLMTLSRAYFNSTRMDSIVDDLSEGSKREARIAGNSGEILILRTDAKPFCKEIVNDQDVEKIRDTYQWLTGKNTFIYRVRNPIRDIEMPVSLGCKGGSWFCIDSIDTSPAPAIGVYLYTAGLPQGGAGGSP